MLLSLFLLLHTFCFAQKKTTNRNFFGKVYSQKIPLSGVYLKIAGLPIDTVSNSEGKYVLQIPKYYLNLYAQKIGFYPKSIFLNTLKTDSLSIFLEQKQHFDGFETNQDWEEQRTILTVQTKNLRLLPTDLSQVLQGRMTGLQIGKITTLRGINSILSSQEPLLVLDGFPLSNQYLGSAYGFSQSILENLEVSQFGAIHLLKDASATALYGSRGANGVLILETQKAKKGFFAEFGTSIGIQSATYNPIFLDSEQYQKILQNSWQNAENQGNVVLPYGLTGKEQTNWQEELQRNALYNKNYFFVKNATEKTTFFANLATLQNNSFQKGQQNQKTHFVVQMAHQVTPVFKVGGKIQTHWINANFLPKNSGWFAQNALPILPVRNGENFAEPTQNPVAFIENQNFGQEQTHLIGQVFTENILTNFITWRNELAFENQNLNENAYKNNGIFSGAWAMQRSSNLQNRFFNSFLLYENPFGENLVKGKIGTNFQEVSRNGLETEGTGFDNDAQKGVTFAKNQSVIASFSSTYRYWSAFADFRYSYKNRYFAGVTYRAEASSRWGKDVLLQHYPAVSAAVLVVKSDSLHQDFLSFLKVSSSFGWSGNSSFPNDFLHQGNFEANASYNNAQGTTVLSLANPNLTPERSRLWDISLDFGLFKHRLTGKITYFDRKTENLLLQKNVPYTSGFANFWTNSGTLQNSGIELSLQFADYLTENLFWESSLNLTQNTFSQSDGFLYSKLAKWAGNNEIFDLSGQKIPATTENIQKNSQNMGKINPDFFGGFENAIRFKNFELRALFSFSFGQQIYDPLWANWETISSTQNALSTLNNTTDLQVPKPIYGSPNAAVGTDRYLRKTDHVRLKTLSFSYKIPESLSKNWYVRSAEISFIGQNVWTNVDFDPENIASLPLAKVWSIGLRVAL